MATIIMAHPARRWVCARESQPVQGMAAGRRAPFRRVRP